MSDNPAAALQVSGPLGIRALYVNRPADQKLPYALAAGKPSYVLAPPQSGKSSLRIRTTAKLSVRGVSCVSLNLKACHEETADQWYLGLLELTVGQLQLDVDLDQFWRSHRELSPSRRWLQFLRSVVLERVKGPLVIFADAVETTRQLPFPTRGFFGSIRTAHDKRHEHPDLARLTFCLLGSASPEELVPPEESPFAIGRAVALEDFTREEADQLLVALECFGERAPAVLEGVLEWTEGHPRMTQKLCKHLVEHQQEVGSAVGEKVKQAVEQLLSEWSQPVDSSLAYVDEEFSRERITSPMAQKMLDLYRKVRSGGERAAEESDPVQHALCLTGLTAVRRAGSKAVLRARNRILADVFDSAWLLTKADEELIAASLQRWLEAGRRERDVLRELSLKVAVDWASGRDDVTREERDFLVAGLEVSRREEEKRRLEVEQQFGDEQARASALEALSAARRQKLRTAVAGVFVLLAGLALALWQVVSLSRQRQEVEAQRARAVAAKEAAERRSAASGTLYLAGQARVGGDDDPAVGLLLAREALQGATDPALRQVAAQALRDRLARFEGHWSIPSGARVGPDGRWLLTPGEGTWRLFDLQQPEPLRRPVDVVAPRGKVTGFAVSPDRRWLAMLLGGGDLALWDLGAGAGKAPATLAQGQRGTLAVTISPDSRWLVMTNTWDRDPRAWRLDQAARSLHLEGHRTGIRSAVITGDGRWLVTEDMTGRVRLWDLSRESPAAGAIELGAANNSERTLAVSADGRWLATAARDTVHLWDLRVIRPESPPLRLGRHAGVVSATFFSPDGKSLVTGDATSVLRWSLPPTPAPQKPTVVFDEGANTMAVGPAWIAAVGGEGRDIQLKASGSRPVVLPGAAQGLDHLAVSGDGRWLVTTQRGSVARLWDLRRAERSIVPFAAVQEPGAAAVFTADSRRLVVAGRQRTRIFDLERTEPGAYPIRLKGHAGKVTAMALGRDGALAASAGGRTVRLWSLGSEGLAARAPVLSHPALVAALALDRRGGRVVTVDVDGDLRGWDLESGTATRLGRDGDLATVLALGDDRRWLVVGGGQSARLWDLAAKPPTRVAVLPHGQAVRAVAVNAGWIVTAGGRGVVRLWKLGAQGLAASGTPPSLQGHGAAVLAAAFSADGRWLVTVDARGEARRWDLQRGGAPAERLTLPGASINAVALRPDLQGAALLDAEGRVRLWELSWDRGAGPARVVAEHPGAATVVVTGDGDWLATADGKGTVAFWPQRPEPLLQAACRVAGRSLSQQEWSQLLPHLPFRKTCP